MNTALPLPNPEQLLTPAIHTDRRYLAVHLPKLSTDRIARQRWGNAWRLNERRKTPPIIMVEKQKNAIRLVRLDEAAELLGLEYGTSLTDARAAFPAIEILQSDHKADETLLLAIVDWCDRYTPLVAIDKSDADNSLMLDVTGCAHLFGGEKSLISDLLARLFQQGFAASGAIASTPGAAWALSRYRPPKPLSQNNNVAVTIIKRNETERALALLPVAALRIEINLVASLARLGLRTIGQILACPRAPLTRRFGKALIMRLDQALGAIDEPITPRLKLPELMAERRFAEPLVRTEDIESVTLRLAGHLVEDLEKRGKGVRLLQLALYRVDGKVLRLEAGTSRPLREASVIANLFRERLAALHDDFDAGFGFETVRLSALYTEILEARATDFMTAANADEEAADLIDRLAARLGQANILKGELQNTHLPEDVEQQNPGNQISTQINTEKPTGEFQISCQNISVRPLRIFAFPEPVDAIAEVPEGPPVRFRWRKVLHEILRAEGPERINDEWWAKTTPRPTRDYFRVEDQKGHRYWIFREGLYGSKTPCSGPTGPRWFMHGIFA